MKVKNSHLIERQGVTLIQQKTWCELCWLFREQSYSDVGIDAQVEIIEDGLATGFLFALQIKSGESYFKEPTKNGFIYRGKINHLEYWLRYLLPVLLVICNPSKKVAYWQVISESNISRTNSGWKIEIPVENSYGSATKEQLHNLAPLLPQSTIQPGGFYSIEPNHDISSIIESILSSSKQLLPVGRYNLTKHADYCCKTIASFENYRAILVTEHTTEGALFVFCKTSRGWVVQAQMSIQTKFKRTLPAFFIPGNQAPVLVIRHPAMWGTGCLLEMEKWYLLLEDPKIILEYPISGYVVGWGMLFNRYIESKVVDIPSFLSNAVTLEVNFNVEYRLSKGNYGDIEFKSFKVAKNMHLQWDENKRQFFTLSTSGLSPKEALALYTDDEMRFITKNIETLLTMCGTADADYFVWLKEIANSGSQLEKEKILKCINSMHG